MTGEQLDDRTRARMLDEGLEVLQAAWSGEPVDHDGAHYMVAGMRFLPRPVQRPGIPIWVAGYPGNRAPRRRASRHQGYVPGNLVSAEQLGEIVTDISDLRRLAGKDPADAFDIVAALPIGVDPTAYIAAGATWWLVEFPDDGARVDSVRGVIRDGPRP
jgi:alkanesulfonate monooxygenase SsuD/methylene tetrahydromethanopterin reductase-like flavin-dependent oxidoreductase (luciferase family)